MDHDVTALLTPESDVADSLRVIGDRVQEEYGEQLDEIVGDLLRRAPVALTYSVMQGMSSRLLHHTQHGWTKVCG